MRGGMTAGPSDPPRGGLPSALAAYFIWGLLPLYLVLLNHLGPARIVAWRIVMSLPICLVLGVMMGSLGDLRRAMADRRSLALLVLSSLLIAGNWVVYVIAVQAGQFYAASLGYYINPLINVLIGTAFLGERLSRLQWAAVALAAVGIAILAAEAVATLAISLALALSFGFYGLVRKKVAVDALPGLTVEVMLATPFAILTLFIVPAGVRDFGNDAETSLLLFGAGVVTAVPLLLFATAARRMTYSALGFVQFLAPTLVFLCGLFVFHQPLVTAQLVCFVLIWSAVALFCADMLLRGRKRPPALKF